MMYRSHTGKTKAGKTFEKFLGKKEYDKSFLSPFERFLHSSFCEYHSNIAINWQWWTYLFYSSRGLCSTQPFERGSWRRAWGFWWRVEGKTRAGAWGGSTVNWGLSDAPHIPFQWNLPAKISLLPRNFDIPVISLEQSPELTRTEWHWNPVTGMNTKNCQRW